MRTFAEYGIEVHGSRGEVRAVCPRCAPQRKPVHQREKDLAVNIDEGVWHCHHCGWAGGLGSEDAWRERPPITPTYTPPRPPAESDSILPRAILAWFAKRGIPDWVLADRHITAGAEFCPQLGREVTAIRFPYSRDGELVNIKFRGPEKTFWMSKGAERILYGLDDIAGAEEIVIVEGEMDKLAIDAVQGPACVSVPDGAPPPETKHYATKFAYLESAEAYLRAAKRVLIAVDADAAGDRLADELARRLGYGKCARVRWASGAKDANQVLMEQGARALCDALTAARPYPVDGLVAPDDLVREFESLYERGLDRGVATGRWPAFDRYCRARGGLLAVLTGSPGSGKSHFLDNWILHLAQQHGWTFGMCSPENQPLERHAAGLVQIWQGVPFGDGPTPRMSWGEAREGLAWLDRHLAFILPDEPTIASILERAEVLIYRLGIRGLVIDPWNELDHSRPPGMSETEYVSIALTTIRNWARRRGVMVFLVAHPTKLVKDSTGKYPPPTPYDISGSAHWFNKADFCLSVYRGVDDQNVPGDDPEVFIQKVRFAETGQLGVVPFHYDRPTGRFVER
jgi:twinkle protein